MKTLVISMSLVCVALFGVAVDYTLDRMFEATEVVQRATSG